MKIMFPINRCAAVVTALVVAVQLSCCAALSVQLAQPVHSSSWLSLPGPVAGSDSQLVELRRSQVPKTTLPLQTQRLSSYSTYDDSNSGRQESNREGSPAVPSSTLHVTSDLRREFSRKSSQEILSTHEEKNFGDISAEDLKENFDKVESYEDSLDEFFDEKSSEAQETVVKSEDNDFDNDIDDSATRATMLWRAMVARFPGVASKAAMYWRVLAANDPATAAREAMAARKMIAEDPEKMARAAISPLLSDPNHQQQWADPEPRRKRTSASPSASLPPYWLEFAAHDPEVTARSALFWVNDDQANMYW